MICMRNLRRSARREAGSGLGGDALDGVAEDAGGEGAGFDRHLRAGDAAVVLADEAVAQGVEEGGLAGERGGALDALVERGKKAHEAEHPEIEVGDGQPDGAVFERLEDGPGEAEDAVVGLAVGEEFVEHFGNVGEGDQARVVHGRRERRQKHVTGFEAREIAARAVLPVGADAGERLECPAEALAGALGGLGDTLDLALRAGEEGDEQVGLAQRIGAEDDGLGLLEGHGMGLYCNKPPGLAFPHRNLAGPAAFRVPWRGARGIGYDVGESRPSSAHASAGESG